MSRRPAALLMMTLALTGCTVDQRRDVALYRDVVDLPGAITHEPGAPLSLEQALRLTNAANERLSLEGENYLQALIDRQRTAASLLPTLDLFGNLTFRDRAGGGGESGGGEGGGSQSRRTLFDAGLGAQYTLFTGLTDFNRARAAKLTAEQRRWLLLDLREALLLETAQAYYAVLQAERLVQVLESSVAVQEQRLRDIRARQEVGFARPLDVAQIEAQASDTRVALLDARNQAANARSALALLTGAEVHASPLTDEFSPPDAIPDLDHLLALAYDRRQDLIAAAEAARAARFNVDAEIGRYYPTVSVNLDYFLTRDTAPTDRDWAGLLSINLPIFSAGRIDADVRDAWSRFRQAILNHSLTRRQIRRDVETEHQNLTATAHRVQELRYQVQAAAEALRQAEAAYQAGLGTNLERIAAQDQLLSAEVRLVSEEFNAKVAYLAALRAAGVLTEGVTGVKIPAPPPESERAIPTSPFIGLPGGSGADAAAVPNTPGRAHAPAG